MGGWLFCPVLRVAATLDTWFWYLPSVLCWGMPIRGQKVFQPHQQFGNQSFLGQYKVNQFCFGVFGIWGRVCGRGRLFLLLHPKPGGHGGQAPGKLLLGPTAWPGPWPIALGAPGTRWCSPPAKWAMWLLKGGGGCWKEVEGVEPQLPAQGYSHSFKGMGSS